MTIMLIAAVIVIVLILAFAVWGALAPPPGSRSLTTDDQTTPAEQRIRTRLYGQVTHDPARPIQSSHHEHDDPQ
jgi:hypothetical protein